MRFFAVVLLQLVTAASDNIPWISDWDYPKEAIARQEQGVVRYRLRVDEHGRVRSCTVTESSGSPSLDEATCRLMKRRAFFKPAGLPGLEEASVRTGEHEWKLPPRLMHPETMARELEKAADELEDRSREPKQ